MPAGICFPSMPAHSDFPACQFAPTSSACSHTAAIPGIPARNRSLQVMIHQQKSHIEALPVPIFPILIRGHIELSLEYADEVADALKSDLQGDLHNFAIRLGK